MVSSFGREFPHTNPAVFPTLEPETFYSYVAAAFWGDADTRLDGEVYYELHVAADNPISEELIGRVNDFLAQEQGVDFDGNWMLVVHWNNIPPFPHGLGFIIPEVNYIYIISTPLCVDSHLDQYTFIIFVKYI